MRLCSDRCYYTMELLTEEEIFKVIKQLGYSKAEYWSVKEYSDQEIGYLGEHLSLIVTVDADTVLKCFVKCLPRFEVWKAEYIKETTFFEKEYSMLTSLFQKFEPGTEKWRPKLLFAKKDLFVFEDVAQMGYTMVQNRDTLDLEEVNACVATMARFHAQSYIYEEKRTRELNRPYRIWEDYNNYLQEPVNSKCQNWRDAGMNAAIDFLKVYSRFKSYPNFDQKVEVCFKKLFAELLTLVKPHAENRNVVVHRDLWMNNILFKRETNGSLRALFVDFQTVLYCPPMLDLSSFIYFNTRKKFRDTYYSDIIDLYYSILRKELEASNFNIIDIIDRESLHNYYEESIRFGIVQAALIVPITLIDKDKYGEIFNNPDILSHFYEVSRGDVFIQIAKNDERFRNHVVELFDEIVEKYIF